MKRSVKPFTSRAAFDRIDLLRSIEVLREEVDGGFDINEVNGSGETLLSCACWGERASPAWVQDLLSFGANPNTKNSLGSPAVLLAVIAEHWEIVEILAKAGANLDEGNQMGLTPLSKTVHDTQRGQEEKRKEGVEKIKLLLSLGADPNHIEAKGSWSPFHMVVSASFRNACGPYLPSLLAMMEENGADLNLPDKQGQTPLMFAVQAGPFDTALWLLSRNADLDAVDDHGRSALEWCDPGFRGHLASFCQARKLQEDVSSSLQGSSLRRL